MKSSLVLFTLALVLAAPAVAIAGSGDPRLVNGVLEWPRAVTNEPFLVVRGDDGVLYYVGIAAARRDGPLVAGARVSALGLEGRTPNEITALGVGAGDTTEAALAHLQGTRPAPAATSPPAPAAVAPVAVTPPPPTPTPGATVTSGPAVPTTPTGPAAAPAAAVTPPAPAITAPAPVVIPPAPAVTPPPPPAPSATAIMTMLPTAPARSPAAPAPVKKPGAETIAAAAALPASAGDNRRWTEISGVVESLVGRTLVLRSDEGRVAVDVSSLSQNLDRMATPGSTLRVYGVPVEMRFKAMGVFDPGSRP